MAIKDGQILVYNATGNNWDNKDPAATGDVSTWSKFPATQDIDIANFNIRKVTSVSNNQDDPSAALTLQAQYNKNSFSAIRITPEGFEVAVRGFDNNSYKPWNPLADTTPINWSDYPALKDVDMKEFGLNDVSFISNTKDDDTATIVLAATYNGSHFTGMKLTPDGFEVAIKGGGNNDYKPWDPFAAPVVSIANGGFFTSEIEKGSSESYGTLQSIFSNFAAVNYFDDTTNAYYTAITNELTLKNAFSIGRVRTTQVGVGNEVILWFNAGNDITIKARRNYGIYVGGSFLGFTQVFSINVSDFQSVNFTGPIPVYKYIAILNITGGETRLFIYLDSSPESGGKSSYVLQNWTGPNGGIELILGGSNKTEFFANVQFIIKTPVTN